MTKLFAKIAYCRRRFAEGLPRDLIRRGSALGLVLVFMTFMLVLGTGLLTVGQYMAIQSRAVGESDKYYYAAESAAQLAAQLLMREYNASADGGSADGVSTGGVFYATALGAFATEAGAAAPDEAVLALKRELIGNVLRMYEEDVMAVISSYGPGGTFNGVPVTLGPLRVSNGGTVYVLAEALEDDAQLQSLEDDGILSVEGRESILGDGSEGALAVYFSNPNFVLTASAGGREVIVNTSVSLDFSVNIGYTTSPDIPGTPPARLATVKGVTIAGWVGENLGHYDLDITITGDKLIDDEEEIAYIINYALDGDFVHDLPDDVQVDEITEGDIDTANNTLRLTLDGIALQPKSGPVRITLPGGIFASGKPLAVTREGYDEARWNIRYREGDFVSRLPAGSAIVNPGEAPDYKAFMDRRIAEARLFATKGNFIPAGLGLTATEALKTTDVNVNAIVDANNRFAVNASGAYNLEYLYCSGNVRINEGIQAAFPNLKGIYVEGNLTLQKSSRLIVPNSAAIYVGGLLSVSDKVELNNCSVYANEIEIYYSAATLQGGPFNSKSVFYPRSRLRLFGVPSADANTMPQFYIPESCAFDFDCERFALSNLPGIFFLQGERRTDGIANEGVLSRATGLFVGNFGNISRTDVISQTVLDSLWDNDLKNFLNGTIIETLAAKAEIEDDPQIIGMAGAPLEEDVAFTVYVEGDEIAPDKWDSYLLEHEPSELFWSVPDGIDIECSYRDSHTLRFTVYGTPESPLDAPVDIRLPGEIMESGVPVDSELNEEAFWNISGIPGSEGSSTLDSIELTPDPGNGAVGAELHDITGNS